MSSNLNLIRPITVTDSILDSSNVLETPPTLYDAGTTYDEGDEVGVAGSNGEVLGYISLQGSNTGNTPASSPLYWLYTSSTYEIYSGATSYALDFIVTDTATHSLYKSLAAGNLGNALTDATKWEYYSPTNTWAMFDEKFQTQTYCAESISVEVSPGEIVNSVALLNVEGASATVTQTTSGYSRTISLVEHNVLNWYDWFYELPIRTGDTVFSDIPPYPSDTLTITIDNAGGVARCGVCVIGKSKTLGETQWDASRTINDYSQTSEDASGNVSLAQGSYSKRLNVDFYVMPGYESEVIRTLEQYRSTPLVFVGSEDYSASIVYGFLGAWGVPFSATGRKAYLEIKGLI